MRLRNQISQTRDEIQRAQEALVRSQDGIAEAQEALKAAESRQPVVESLVGFLVGTREQNGFGEKFRITALTRSDVTERHA
jgi:hypothetical protein